MTYRYVSAILQMPFSRKLIVRRKISLSKVLLELRLVGFKLNLYKVKQAAEAPELELIIESQFTAILICEP